MKLTLFKLIEIECPVVTRKQKVFQIAEKESWMRATKYCMTQYGWSLKRAVGYTRQLRKELADA